MRRTGSSVLALVMSWSVLCAARAVGDAPPAIAVGEMATQAGDQLSADALGDALSRALSGRDDVRLAVDAARARYVLRGSIVRLTQRDLQDGLEVRCEVSLVVSDARGGAIRALLSGRAGARGTNDVARLSQAALEGAVRGALRPLGERLH